jgi:NAD(P)-dependent dehydrogenase (short-subunit alcohol dehydrogenase family)
MLLEDKNAIIYGAGGAIGGAVARAFAREGARVFLAGRTREKLDKVAGEIRVAGGAAETARVDALDEKAVGEHADAVVERAGSIDVSFNAISIRDVQLIPLVEMSREDFMSPILTGTSTHFLTARAAGRRMVEQGSGVILTLSSSAVRAFVPRVHVGASGSRARPSRPSRNCWRRNSGRKASAPSACGRKGYRRAGRASRPRVGPCRPKRSRLR